MRILLALLIAASLQAQAPGRARRAVTDEEVERVHRSALLIDTHNDVTGRIVEGLDIGKPSRETHTDLPRMRRGGMGAQFFAAYVAASYVKDNHAARRALEMIDTIRRDIVERYPKDFTLALTAADIRRAHERGQIAALIGIEGGHAIEDSLRLLRQFYALGVRYMTLTHVNSIHWADSAGDTAKPNNGLSPFGKDVVREMNRLGMIVDISHVSDKTFWDALEVSRAPIFASHSSCRSVSPSPRNLTDEMLRELGKKRGLIQINFDCGYLNAGALKAVAERSARLQPLLAELRKKYASEPAGARRALREARASIPPDPAIHASLADVVRHINHAVSIAGVDAVGLGGDFDGVSCVPEGLASVDQWPNLTRALLEEGYTAAEIRKIYGENMLRLMTEVERAAGR
jgi:membrane dipeptidase